MGDPNRDIVPIQSESIINKALPVVDYIDGVREVRTGVGKITQGLDADVLQNSTASAFDVATSSANQRIEAVARIFAETGVSDLVRGVHELLIKNQDFQTKAKLKEGWTDIDPTQWRHRSDVTVKVGLGNNNDEARKQNLAMLMQVMEKSAAFGIVMPNNAYNFAEQAAKELGFQKRGVFFTDPQSPEYQKMMQQKSQEKNPLVEIEEMKSQVKMMSEQMKQQHQQQKLQLEAMQSRGEQQLEAARAQMDQMEKDRRFALDVTDTELKYATDLMKTGIGAELGRGRA
jgi:TPP-dependent indolepyruvate ferredoxin oxidoreductase alpha subunit